MGSIAKAVKRVIPKEIQPILPIAASMFAGPLVGAKLSGIGALATRPVLTQALASGLTSAGTDFLTSGKVDPKTLLTSTLMGAGGQYFKDVGAGSRGIMGLDLSDKAREQFSNIGNLMAPTGVDADTGKFDLSGDIIKSGSTAITAGGSIAAYNAAEEAQREYDEMMAGREADAAADRQSRIDYITRYMNMAGFSQAEIDDALGRAGYRTGGRVGFAKGGSETLGDSMQSIKILLMKNQIIVDTYGGWARHGGGAFSGKDPSKVDRSAAYFTRWVAKNIVAAGLAESCELEVAYAIGHPYPTSIHVDTFGTHTVEEAKIVSAIQEVFDFKPAAIIEQLDLLNPIYKGSTHYGHFGKDDLPWECLSKVEALKQNV